MLEFIFEVVGELLLQVVGEVLVEFGFQSLAAPFQREPNPWLAALGYTIFGAVVGGLSLLVFPTYLVANPQLRVVNTAVTPVLTGFCMAALGAWRARRGQRVLRIDKFSYGYLFALAFGLVRFWFAA
jgi:hypothetical protein